MFPLWKVVLIPDNYYCFDYLINVLSVLSGGARYTGDPRPLRTVLCFLVDTDARFGEI